MHPIITAWNERVALWNLYRRSQDEDSELFMLDLINDNDEFLDELESTLWNWAKIKEGPRAGELVPTIDVNPSINLITEHGVLYRAMGYGSKLPTRYKVRVFDNRWRRVYMYQYSNAGTAYILHKGEAFSVSW